jgi:hypothetical protein
LRPGIDVRQGLITLGAAVLALGLGYGIYWLLVGQG